MKKLKKLKLNKAKLAFEELEREMSIINDKAELKKLVGGTGPPNGNECVIYCLDSLDGASNNHQAYLDFLSTGFGGYYDVDTGFDGVHSSHIEELACEVGGLTVQRQAQVSFVGDTGVTTNGNRVMLTYKSGGQDHAVIVTGNNGSGTLCYEDPSNNDSSGSLDTSTLTNAKLYEVSQY